MTDDTDFDTPYRVRCASSECTNCGGDVPDKIADEDSVPNICVACFCDAIRCFAEVIQEAQREVLQSLCEAWGDDE
jgi:hypothetical protein